MIKQQQQSNFTLCSQETCSTENPNYINDPLKDGLDKRTQQQQ